jgi:subtilisin family serine protease
MNGDKFDARLRAECEERMQRGASAGISLTDVGQQAIPVTISHAAPLECAPGKDRKRVIKALQKNFDTAQAEPMKLLKKLGVKTRKLPLSNSIATNLTMTQLQQVEQLDDVGKIRLVKPEIVTCLNQSARVIGAVDTWDVQNFTGYGVRVAVLDSGVDGNHPALAGKVVAEDSTVPSEGVDVPGDHGTHVAGIIASQDTVRRGVAHGADIINVKVLTAGGSGDHTWVEDGMQRAYELGADVVNMSLGWSHIYHGWECPDGFCSLCRAAQSLVDLGVVVVVAAGNEDNAKEPPPPDGDTNLRCPGQCRGVITVGGVQKDLAMYTNSSLGPPSYWDGWTVSIHLPFCLNLTLPFPGEPWVTKPDLCAPGVGINSTVLNDGWASFTGTSMASPHVAGVAALMLQKHPGMPPQTAKNILVHTAYELPFDRFTCGAGLVDAYGAVLHS